MIVGDELQSSWHVHQAGEICMCAPVCARVFVFVCVCKTGESCDDGIRYPLYTHLEWEGEGVSRLKISMLWLTWLIADVCLWRGTKEEENDRGRQE
jgi:hypothetical protein